jgi:oxygen-independent coproporphyrinogen-3 oxidase
MEELDRLTLIKETLLMGFRYCQGPDAGLFQRRFGVEIKACIPQTIARWRERGFLESEPLALTKKGLLFLDAFLLDAFREVEKLEDKRKQEKKGW